MRLLIVDDSQLNLSLLSEYMTHVGHEITCANGGVECLGLIEREEFDCVLLDIQMPDMDGISVLERLRSSPKPALRELPVIALTALAFPKDRNMCLDAGASLYVSKPFSFKELAGILENLDSHIASRYDN
ncbi:MAG: Sensory/regulatory protein RpfC [Nitrosomonadaceae bacterium]|nr:Sensory/regulatory protein RpfC [Nitrosomonadaceae bacterium]